MEEELIDEPTRPGQYLAYEREKKGFTIEDIAGKLYLSPHIVRALEENTYDQLPEPVYVRGYLRSYCRLLRIDPMPVLDMYTKNLPQEEDYLLEDLALSSPISEHQQRLIMFWGSIAVIAIFLILIISWWQEKQPVTGTVNAPATIQSNSTEQSHIKDARIPDTPIKREEIPADTKVEIEPKEIVSPTLEQEIIDSEADIEAELKASVSPPILNPTKIEIKEAVRENGVSDGIPFPASTNSDDVDIRGTTALGSNNRQSDEIVDIQQRVTLVVMASGDSWARVRDGNGEIIIHRILPADYNKIFMVNLPLKFEFGNAHRVRIMIDGKNYNFSSHIRSSKTANFEVTELP